MQKFGSETIVKESKIYDQVFKAKESYTSKQIIEISMNSLEDETDWFQYGQMEQRDFFGISP